MPADFPSGLVEALADRYAIERELGRGGMATVYLARDLRHDRMVALKVMRPELAAAIGNERFLREIQIAARLNHPHVLALYDSGDTGEFLYYVMPYVEGESLRDRMDRHRQLPIDEALLITREVADALSYAHSHDVVHRDIKPENILLASGHAVVADFGIARAISEAGGDRLTETGLSIGTPSYMSPEQAAGEKTIDGKSDIYSLGCVLYEMLAGEPPHTGPNPQAIIAKRLTEPVASLRTTRETIAPETDDALLRALARVPADRYATAAEFVAALTPSVTASGATPAAAAPAGRNPIVSAAIASLALVAVVVVVMLFARGNTPSLPADVIPSIAVLPFENLGAPENEYFADGITEEMTSRLAEISGLGIVSRTSTLQYKGTTRPLQEIGGELNVQYVLEGTVRTDRSPDGTGQVRVTPQLIHVGDDRHLWTERYTASLMPGEIFAVQAEIAEQVATALGIALLGEERDAVRAVPTADPAAHEAYLLGRFHWNTRTSNGLRTAATHFHTATERDSAYAAAWAGLADAYVLSPLYGVFEVSRPEAYRRAIAAARRAVALDTTFAEAYASLGEALMYGAWDWAGAEQAFQRAIALDPGYPTARYWYAEFLHVQGRIDEALEQARRGAQLAPAAPVAQHMYAWLSHIAGDTATAIEYSERAVELEPSFSFARNTLGLVHLARGQYDEALAQLVLGDIARPLTEAIIDATRDPLRRNEAVGRIAAYLSNNPPTDPAMGAVPYMLLEVRDSVLAWMERAFAQRTELFFLLIRDTPIHFMRDYPRYVDLLRRAGLDP